MIMSIGHRASGIALMCGTLLLVLWLICLALGPDSYNFIKIIINHWFGQFIIFCYSFIVFYHLFNGIRHLSWDLGYGYEIEKVYLSGYLVFIFAIIFTSIIWSIVWFT